ncbi:MAG: GNAT family N-acetyltransferase [Muribaculaceae bacterium]|nr:GNAT family N-acetyltransferase [Muribaculaceae bacterium]
MIRIEDCCKADGELIARAVVMALHEEFDPEELWCRIFMNLAVRTDSQYSYLNALKAVTDEGEVAGILVCYDGARLAELRQALFDEYERLSGRKLGAIADETDAGEWYLDSLAVFPGFRGRGIAKALIQAAVERTPEGKRPGLLCAKDNANARRLYESLGFRKIGERPFLGQLMDHMIYEK